MMTEGGAYERCPKCFHAPLPSDQELPAACPACGLILAKFAAAEFLAKRGEEGDAVDESGAGRWQQLRLQLTETILYVPPRIEPAAFWGRATLLLLFVLWGMRLIWMDHRTGELGSSFLHGPLLIFHEAGHVIFMPFGEFMTILGGTLGQLLMPLIMAGALLIRTRDPFASAIAMWLFGVSLLDVAPYVYDALHPQLVLLGGHTGEEGGHDWIYLLSETGWLQRAQGLGWLAHKIGALVVLLSTAWAGWILMQQKARSGERLV